MSLLSFTSLAVLSMINSSLGLFASTLTTLKKFKTFSLSRICFNSRFYQCKCGLSTFAIVNWENEKCGLPCVSAIFCLPYFVPLLILANIDFLLLLFSLVFLFVSGILLVIAYLIFGISSLVTNVLKNIMANCTTVTSNKFQSKEYLYYAFLRCVFISIFSNDITYILLIVTRKKIIG